MSLHPIYSYHKPGRHEMYLDVSHARSFPWSLRRATGKSPFGMSEEEGEGGGLLVAPRLISRIAFDSDSQVAVWRLPGTTDEISLPLLTHLLPQRYRSR